MLSEEQNKIIDGINALIKSRGKFLLKEYPQIESFYKKAYNLPDLDPIRHEICICIAFGLYQAAMTLTNHLLESFIKLSLTYNDIHANPSNLKNKPEDKLKSLTNDLKASGNKFNDKNLGDNINKACKFGLITKEEKKQLNEFREKFRNAYSHADRKKQHGDITTPVQFSTIEEGKIKMEPLQEVSLFDLPIFQGIAQWHHAEVFSYPYFEYLDGVIRRTLSIIFPGIENGPNLE